MIKTYFLSPLFVVLFLIIGIPVLGIEWLIGKSQQKNYGLFQSAAGSVGI